MQAGAGAGGDWWRGGRGGLAGGKAGRGLWPECGRRGSAARGGGARGEVGGEQWRRFTAQARKSLMSDSFTVNRNSDRMGYRLEGPALALSAPLEMISEAVTFGTGQVLSRKHIRRCRRKTRGRSCGAPEH